ncbi:trehalose-phosphatase [Herbiconiux sp. YIM B11900]|uniref:trehalose-phosphatase n=1 Tax=Herbiconiux sp. YIM B11900 TaxID=3404131 RepID=UPI003F8492BE
MSPELTASIDRLAATSHLLVALDFDGTLAPEVDDPEAARALPEAHDAMLRLLALPDTSLALVSGRAMASLEHVSELPAEALLVGSHGVEERFDGEVRLALDPHEQRVLARLREVLESVASGAKGAWVEVKPAGFALHTRRSAPDAAQDAQARARTDAAAISDALTVRAGKNVLEFSVRGTTKGEGVQRLRERTGATAVLFAGDDVTDEDGFRALRPGDIGLRSGSGDTVAEFRVDGPLEVAAVLDALASRRSDLSTTGTR